MTDGARAPDDTARSIELERWAGLVVVVSILLMVVVGSIDAIKFLFWVPFAVGIGLVLPLLAMLADREREGANDDDGAAGNDDSPDA